MLSTKASHIREVCWRQSFSKNNPGHRVEQSSDASHRPAFQLLKPTERQKEGTNSSNAQMPTYVYSDHQESGNHDTTKVDECDLITDPKKRKIYE